MRVIVLGGAGNFGARIVRALRGDPTIDLLVAGRRSIAVPGAEDVPCAVVDIGAPEFAQQLRALSPELVSHCAGPFQGQDYGVANSALAAGTHYLDLADGRQFIVEFAARVKDQAVRAARVAISGASTLPALSSAVVEELRVGLSRLESIEIIIAPGQRAPRGKATLEAVFSYLGCPFQVWRKGQWRRAWGWMELQETRLDIGRRLAAACDVPDLELFSAPYAGIQTVGGRMRRTWQLTASAIDGPEIPCMAAILLARRLARGEVFASGAFPCIGFLTLLEFAPEFARWKITTRVEEVAA